MNDYCTLTLLNTHYKIYARVLARRLSTILGDIVHPRQYCCARERKIIIAADGIRDVLAYAAQTQRAICILSLDFQTAFDNVSRIYFYHILSEHGFDDTSVKILRALYKNATSKCQVNGFVSQRFPIECSVRQRSPLCMIMHAIALNSLMASLAELEGLKIMPTSSKISVFAYADITIILTSRH